MNGGQRTVLGALGVMVVLVTIRSVSTKPGLPSPGGYFGAGVLFSMLLLLATPAPALAGTLAVGAVVAGLFAPYLPGGSGDSPITQFAGLVSQISGGSAAATTAPGGPTA